MDIIERLEPIRAFEKQSGLARLLIFLHLEGSSNISSMIDRTNIQPNVAYIAVRKATEMKLITSTYDEVSNYRVRMLRLTDKGRRVANCLNELNDMLSE